MGQGASHPRHDDLTALAGLAEQDLPVRALYVVALPIGNAADITLRALWTLARVDAIAAEDTRVTGPLLARYGIATPVLAAHQHNERTVAAAIVERLQKGQRVALVSDAGTPGVSDPGAVIVRTVLEADLRVIPIPGASSALAAVSAAGLRATGFRFIGFLPAGARERERLLRDIASSNEAVVLFEAPHRIRALQGELSHILPADRRVLVARELTKKFETIHVHTASALANLDPEERGEYVIVIDAAEHEDRPTLDPQGQRWLDALLDEMTPARAAAVVSRMTGVPRSVVYDEAIGRRRKPPAD